MVCCVYCGLQQLAAAAAHIQQQAAHLSEAVVTAVATVVRGCADCVAERLSRCRCSVECCCTCGHSSAFACKRTAGSGEGWGCCVAAQLCAAGRCAGSRHSSSGRGSSWGGGGRQDMHVFSLAI